MGAHEPGVLASETTRRAIGKAEKIVNPLSPAVMINNDSSIGGLLDLLCSDIEEFRNLVQDFDTQLTPILRPNYPSPEAGTEAVVKDEEQSIYVYRLRAIRA